MIPKDKNVRLKIKRNGQWVLINIDATKLHTLGEAIMATSKNVKDAAKKVMMEKSSSKKDKEMARSLMKQPTKKK